jgi:hypothetical protein
MQHAELIVSRSGYTTLMDLGRVGPKRIGHSPRQGRPSRNTSEHFARGTGRFLVQERQATTSTWRCSLDRMHRSKARHAAFVKGHPLLERALDDLGTPAGLNPLLLANDDHTTDPQSFPARYFLCTFAHAQVDLEKQLKNLEEQRTH